MNVAHASAAELSTQSHFFLNIAPISYPTKSCHDMTEKAAEGRNEVVGLEEEWDNSWARERNVCMAVTCGDVPMGCSQKERISSDAEHASKSSDTLNLPPNTMFRETSRQLWPCLQVFRITTFLFMVGKKTHFATLQPLYGNSVKSLP